MARVVGSGTIQGHIAQVLWPHHGHPAAANRRITFDYDPPPARNPTSRNAWSNARPAAGSPPGGPPNLRPVPPPPTFRSDVGRRPSGSTQRARSRSSSPGPSYGSTARLATTHAGCARTSFTSFALDDSTATSHSSRRRTALSARRASVITRPSACFLSMRPRNRDSQQRLAATHQACHGVQATATAARAPARPRAALNGQGCGRHLLRRAGSPGGCGPLARAARCHAPAR